MARRKVTKAASKTKRPPAPKGRKKTAVAAELLADTSAASELVMPLFAPGMTVMHRVGLGGLACTLRALEKAVKKEKLFPKSVPGGPWPGGKPPWLIEPDRLTLRFGKPEAAGEFLKRLFAYAFQITKQGLIYLPGQFAGDDAAPPVLADLQQGLLLTFLQHGRTRTLAKEPVTVSYDPESKGAAPLIVEYRKCSCFKHQDLWQEMADKKGRLATGAVEVIGPLNPGAVVRHVAFTTATRMEDPVTRALPLCFALVGCLALPMSRVSAALLAPDVNDLKAFVAGRAAMTPNRATQCVVSNAADGALQTQTRLQAAKVADEADVPGCYAMSFRSMAWASQQKSRASTLMVPSSDVQTLRRFSVALQTLPSRIVTHSVQDKVGKGKQAKKVERQFAFRADSVVRPLVAENLARGQPWYRGFAVLMTARDGFNKPLRDKVSFEKKGLQAMIENSTVWDHAAETALVHAVHEAIRCRYGKIADENKGKQAAMKNRFANEYDRLRLAFSGAKTVDQFRETLCDLFSRAGRNTVLQQSWAEILPLLREPSWRAARDLSLLALASYVGSGKDDK